jgi:hypothetical protein
MSSSVNIVTSNQPTVPIAAPPKQRSKHSNRSPAFKQTVDLMKLLPIESVAQAQNISVRQVYRRVSRWFQGRRDEYLQFRAERRVVTLGREIERLSARTDATVEDNVRRLPGTVREERLAPLLDEPVRRLPGTVREERLAPLLDEPVRRQPPFRDPVRSQTQVARVQISPPQEMQTPLDLNRSSRRQRSGEQHSERKRRKLEHRRG